MRNTKVVWAGRILSTLIGLMFVFNSLMKLFPQVLYPQMIEQMAGIGLPEWILPIIATLEIICVVLYLVPMTSVLGAVLFTGYLGGAILTHLRVGEAVYVQVTLGLLVWLGIYLREPRLRDVLPFRTKM